MRVFVYRNLHRDCFSIRHRGRVIDHADSVVLAEATFSVGPKGRERVIREGRKNVHAGVRGELVNETLDLTTEVCYNPYKRDHFWIKDTGSRIDYADRVLLINNRIYI